MRKLQKILRSESKTVYERLVDQLNEDKAKDVTILEQDFTRVLVMYRTDILFSQ